MLSTRWQPLAEINQLRNEMDRLFGRHGVRGNGRSSRSYPALNIWESDDNLIVEAELPGFQMADLEMYVTAGNQLSIKGERKQPETTEGTWHRQERGFGTFGRVVELPYQVDAEQVSAEFEHGVLRITLPKAEEAKPRKITVKAK
jgi:HSP20 family protein